MISSWDNFLDWLNCLVLPLTSNYILSWRPDVLQRVIHLCGHWTMVPKVVGVVRDTVRHMTPSGLLPNVWHSVCLLLWRSHIPSSLNVVICQLHLKLSQITSITIPLSNIHLTCYDIMKNDNFFWQWFVFGSIEINSVLVESYKWFSLFM